MSLQERTDKMALLAAEMLRMGQAGEHLSWSLECSKPLMAKRLTPVLPDAIPRVQAWAQGLK